MRSKHTLVPGFAHAHTMPSDSGKRFYGRFEHLGPRTLTINRVVFRGRLLRDRTDGTLRFVVNRLSNGDQPVGWPHKEEWIAVSEHEVSRSDESGSDPPQQ